MEGRRLMSADLAANSPVSTMIFPLPADAGVVVSEPTDILIDDAAKSMSLIALPPDGTPMSIDGAEPWSVVALGAPAGDGSQAVPLMATSGLAGGKAAPGQAFETLPARADGLPMAVVRGVNTPLPAKFTVARREGAPTTATGGGGSAESSDRDTTIPVLLSQADASANNATRRPLLSFRAFGNRLQRLPGGVTNWNAAGLRGR
jgi:hypothetical protein